MLRPNTDGQLEISFPRDSKFTFPVEGPAETVMSFGPGLTGWALAFHSLGHTRKIHLVSGGIGAHYVNRWTGYNLRSAGSGLETFRQNGTLQARLPQGVDASKAQLPEARYYSDGIAASVGMLTAKNTLDIVLMSSVHTAGVDECHAGVRGAASHLREGGLFVLKAPDVSLGTEAGMDRVAEYATDHLGEPVAQGPCGQLQQHIDPELPIERPASFAIYHKQ